MIPVMRAGREKRAVSLQKEVTRLPEKEYTENNSGEALRKCRLRRASMTVEAAVIVPMAVVLTALLIVLTFYMHNRVWYTCAACEVCIRGNMPAAKEGGEASESAGKLARRRIEDQVMPGSAPELGLKTGKSGTSVRFEGQTYAMFNRVLTPFRIKIEVDRVRPEKYVRLLWAGRGGGG